MLINMLLKTEQGELEALLSGIAAGDREALARLYCRTRAAVYALALSILRNACDAQDVTQDVFVRVWERAPQYRPQGSPMAWLLTIARNESRMKLRQAGRYVELGEGEWLAIPADASAVTPEDRQVLQGALAALSDTERQVVLLHAAAGLKHREIAGLLELPLATVLSKYHRALKKLRSKLEGDDTL
ncbi:RNA polymerase sigma factor [Dysosmobacter sp.]|uniref:RNA polymerase sigma factor n=1 Tax=Dysosmobacter sp. TaxID=2591382 RepID=UPI002A853A58|nr:RNA polymerase sigma factor [Dysosmobacter sp.]MDY3282607.1 RNA polymerase sigma factor [Dysosmobacter sp.]